MEERGKSIQLLTFGQTLFFLILFLFQQNGKTKHTERSTN